MLTHKGVFDCLGVARARDNLYILCLIVWASRARENLYRRKQCFTNSRGSKIQTKFSNETLYEQYVIPNKKKQSWVSKHIQQKGVFDRLGVARARDNLYTVFDCLGVARACDNLYRRKQCFTNSPGSKIQTTFSDETLYEQYLIPKTKKKHVMGF